MVNVETIRTALRFTSTDLDGEIQDTINAAMLDLAVGGLGEIPEQDALIDHAVKNYCRWQFNYLGLGAEYERMYKELKNSLAIAYPEVSENERNSNSCY